VFIMQKRSFAGLLSGLLAVSALAAPPIYAQGAAPAVAPATLGFETMAAVSGPYVGAANPIRDIAGGGLPWIISSAQGELRADGALTVSVRGLVLAQAEPVPGNLQGTNPAPTFHAVVSCQSVDDAGAPMVASVRTADVAASPTGDADISETVSLPQPCVAPIVFVSGGSGIGSWFAATGG
jgi:hypothetical protein